MDIRYVYIYMCVSALEVSKCVMVQWMFLTFGPRNGMGAKRFTNLETNAIFAF